ncbi:hypothetical protein SFC66_06370 [Terribacillus saccharophilus]|uniref:hypothetical protein n=1 Tax=Terribacillus saccharophilus TaxID=361277 RepID=UPI0039823706
MNVSQGGGGSTGSINVNPSEITSIYKALLSIMTDLETTALPAIETIKEASFYTEGKAMKAMDVYPDANEKFKELQDHYATISSLIYFTLEKMVETDQDIALQIAKELGV